MFSKVFSSVRRSAPAPAVPSSRRSVFRCVAPPRALLLCVLLLCFACSAAAQESSDALSQIDRAFKQGDARALVAPAADRLDVSLFGAGMQYSRSQALYVMQDFFKEYPPQRLEWQSNSEAEGSRFAMGRYWYEGGGAPLRVYVRLQEKKLREVRVEQQEN